MRQELAADRVVQCLDEGGDLRRDGNRIALGEPAGGSNQISA